MTTRDDISGEPTIRRTLKTIDAGEVDRIIGNWLSDHCKGEAIALDGKTVRGSKGSTGKGVHLVSALLHKEGVVIAQQAVDDVVMRIACRGTGDAALLMLCECNVTEPCDQPAASAGVLQYCQGIAIS